ncbi:glycerate kinase type-2 family protein [Chitinophaga lutea]
MDHYAQQAERIFRSGVAAVRPQQFMRGCMPHALLEKAERIFVLGAGKAASAMALETELLLQDRITQGLIVTNDPHAPALSRIQTITGGHPVPDQNSLIAGTAMRQMAGAMQPGDLVLFLLSGGASALLADIPEGSTMEELQQLFDSLLKSGADIREMNAVRKHLSAIKGGQLARALHPADIYTIILSDVPGNDPAVIGSGPTVADPTTFAEAWAVLDKYRLTGSLPEGLRHHLQQGLSGAIAETAKPGELPHTRHCVAASNRIALEAAAAEASSLGYHTQILTDTATGEARHLATRLVREALAYDGPYPACLLAGGESTVHVTGTGKGGRNQELALAAGILLKDAPNITFLSAGTDGIDGPTNAAGAVINAALLKKAPAPHPYLDNNDAYHFFQQAGGLIMTGHTHTNVMDLMAILIQRPAL